MKLNLLAACGAALFLFAAAASHSTAGDPGARGIADAMIEAHGGFEVWSKAPTVGFRDTFLPPGASTGRSSVVTVDQRTRRAYLDFPDSGAQIVWDGEKAWSTKWADPTPPRFLALLNYYFVCLPWLVRDDGVVLSEAGPAQLWDDPTEYVTLRMTFEAGVGDTPDDYYLLYIHPETHRLHACEYIVTYAALLPPGVDHTPPHILVFEEFTTADGLLVPTSYTIYETDQSVYFSCKVEGWSFSRPFDEGRMAMPAEAVVDESSPTR